MWYWGERERVKLANPEVNTYILTYASQMFWGYVLIHAKERAYTVMLQFIKLDYKYKAPI